MLDKLIDIFPEQGKRRIRDHDVRLFQDVDALLTPKVTVAFKVRDTYVLGIRDVIAFPETVVFQFDRPFGVVC